MADAFDHFLHEVLAPEARDEDRQFVARVQAGIRIDERLRFERRRIVRNLLLQLVCLSAVAAAALWIGRAPAVAALASESPWLAALILLTGFAALVALMTARDFTESTSRSHFSSLTS